MHGGWVSVLTAAGTAFMGSALAQAGDAARLVPMLKQGGYVIVLRHGATDPSQKDVYPLSLADMTKQRQLSEQGRTAARAIGAAFAKNAIPIGQVYTSQLNRAVETGRLVGARDVTPVANLNDSSAGSASAMAGQSGGGSARHGDALRRMANTKPAAGTNTLIVTHKTNVADAFGKPLADIAEGEAAVFKPDGNEPTLVGRVKSDGWGSTATGK
jgi:broad specificity phosphatase PhoE